MAYDVCVSRDAEKDLLDIYAYVDTHDTASAADHVLETLEETCLTLEALPNRGHVPPELARLQFAAHLRFCAR